jgi:2-succinyl-5-enolpyruvyl-6-hydroxy-3-cyclohexene-1-carboxylate synthase
MPDDMQDLSRHLMAVIAAQLETAHELAMDAQSTRRSPDDQAALVAQLSATIRDVDALVAATAVIERLGKVSEPS